LGRVRGALKDDGKVNLANLANRLKRKCVASSSLVLNAAEQACASKTEMNIPRRGEAPTIK
jgi:hypothetical protein